jgi:VWFA-related protein
VFRKEVQEVMLHAIVVDGENNLITNLRDRNFAIFEDGKPQQVTFFRKEDVPVMLGILIDNSGSMRPKRPQLSEAALKLVEASGARDSVFVVNFGEDPYLDQDFTSDLGKLRAALNRTETSGSTALYDAVVASAEHMNEKAPQQKRVLLVITDGADNASQLTLREALQHLQVKNAPVVYAIVLQSDPRRPLNQGAIRTLCQQTGGTAFFPGSIAEVSNVASAIASDIRSQYVIGYKSPAPDAPGTYHAITAQAWDQSGRALRVSTRAGYVSGANREAQ